MRSLFIPLAAVTALSGCLDNSALVEETSRSAAKGVVKSVINSKFPGVDADRYVDCVMDNADTDQIITLAKAAVTGVDDTTVATVTEIAKEPETLKCIAQSSLGGILG